MATPQSTPDVDNRQPKRWRKYTGMVLKALAVLVLGVFLIEVTRESTNYILSGALFAVVLTYVCFNIGRKHKILASSAALVLTWRIFGVVAILAAILLYAHNGIWGWFHWLHWLVMLPMIVLSTFAFLAGAYFATKMRKDPDAVFTGELYLVASMLGLVVLTKLATWYGVGLMQSLMRYEYAAYVLLAFAACLLVRTNSKRPDMIYADDTPNPAPNPEAHNTDDPDNNPHTPDPGHNPPYSDDDTGPIPGLPIQPDPAAHPAPRS